VRGRRAAAPARSGWCRRHRPQLLSRTALFLTSTKVVALAMKDLDLIKAYIETTRTFLQLSSAGLVVPLAFRGQLAGLLQIPGEAKTPTLLLVSASWLCLLLAMVRRPLPVRGNKVRRKASGFQYICSAHSRTTRRNTRTWAGLWLDGGLFLRRCNSCRALLLDGHRESIEVSTFYRWLPQYGGLQVSESTSLPPG
jgi:hypothetical protein